MRSRQDQQKPEDDGYYPKEDREYYFYKSDLDNEQEPLLAEIKETFPSLRGKRIVEEFFKEGSCDYVYLPTLPNERNLPEFLLNDLPLSANATYAFIKGPEITLMSHRPNGDDMMNLQSQNVLVYLENEVLKYVVKNPPNYFRGEIAREIREESEEGWTNILTRGLHSESFDEIVAACKNLENTHNPILSEKCKEHFLAITHRRKQTLSGDTFFYVDRVFNRITRIPVSLQKLAVTFPEYNQITKPTPLDNHQLEIFRKLENITPYTHNHLDIKRFFSKPEVLTSLGTRPEPFLTLREALKLYEMDLLRSVVSEQGIIALEYGYLTKQQILTIPPLPALKPGMIYHPIAYSMNESKHTTIIKALLTPVGIRAFEKGLIDFETAVQFVRATPKENKYAPASSLKILLASPHIITALENKWLTWPMAAKLAENGSLRCLLTDKGMPLLELAFQEKDKANPIITLDQLAELQWGYQLDELLENEHFVPALMQRRISIPDVGKIGDQKAINTLLQPSGLMALEQGYITWSQVAAMKTMGLSHGDTHILTAILSQAGMHSFVAESLNTEQILRHLECNVKQILRKSGITSFDDLDLVTMDSHVFGELLRSSVHALPRKEKTNVAHEENFFSQLNELATLILNDAPQRDKELDSIVNSIYRQIQSNFNDFILNTIKPLLTSVDCVNLFILRLITIEQAIQLKGNLEEFATYNTFIAIGEGLATTDQLIKLFLSHKEAFDVVLSRNGLELMRHNPHLVNDMLTIENSHAAHTLPDLTLIGNHLQFYIKQLNELPKDKKVNDEVITQLQDTLVALNAKLNDPDPCVHVFNINMIHFKLQEAFEQARKNLQTKPVPALSSTSASSSSSSMFYQSKDIKGVLAHYDNDHLLKMELDKISEFCTEESSNPLRWSWV